MSDLYLRIVNTPVGKTAAQSLGLPAPVPLKRLKRTDQPFIEGDVLVGAGNGARAIATLGSILGASAATLHHASGNRWNWEQTSTKASRHWCSMQPV